MLNFSKVWHGVVDEVSLTTKMEGFVKAKVKTGDYNNASEVVREALRLLQREEEAVREHKAAAAQGIASRPGWA